jgi:hypothetical protein
MRKKGADDGPPPVWGASGRLLVPIPVSPASGASRLIRESVTPELALLNEEPFASPLRPKAPACSTRNSTHCVDNDPKIVETPSPQFKAIAARGWGAADRNIGRGPERLFPVDLAFDFPQHVEDVAKRGGIAEDHLISHERV